MSGGIWVQKMGRRAVLTQMAAVALAGPALARPASQVVVIGAGLAGLSAARVLTEAVKVGPMADKTRQMAACFADPRRSAIHVVTLPEELPVNETLELLAVLQREKTVHVGHLIVNQVLPRVFDERTEAALRSLTLDGGLAPVLDAGRRRLGRERLEAREIARLLQGGRPLIEVPLLSESPLEVHHVDRVAGLLGEVP